MKTIEPSKFNCEFCGKEFIRETSLINHVCETKRRWESKDKRGNQLGFQAWIQFYTKNTNKKKKDYMDFIKSSYYTAFIKFGNYCLDTQVIFVSRYVDWLVKEKVSIDKWNKDSVYSKFIVNYLFEEDPLDAIARGIETTIRLAQDAGIKTKDLLRYGNTNKICYEITKGKISPWMLYHSESGLQFLENLDSTQQKMILEYIHPERWAIKFKRYSNKIPQVKSLLKEVGY